MTPSPARVKIGLTMSESETRICLSCRVKPARCQNPTPEQAKKLIYSLCEKCYCRLNREELKKRQLQFEFKIPNPRARLKR